MYLLSNNIMGPCSLSEDCKQTLSENYFPSGLLLRFQEEERESR